MIYLYDVICYAHPRTSVPTNNARIMHTHIRTHAPNSFYTHPSILHTSDISSDAHARHTQHVREYYLVLSFSNSFFLFSLLFSFSLILSFSLVQSHTLSLSISRSRTRNIRISAFTGEYMPMYVRVHIQSTSRMCFFLRRLQLCNCFRLEEKATRDEQAKC